MVVIRKARITDSKTIAACLFLAMEDILYKFIGEQNPDKAGELMLYFVEKDNNQYSYQNCWIAEDDLKVVAAANVYDGARLAELRQPVIEYVRSKHNKAFDPEDETQAGEYYIDSLGVDPYQYRKGIGTMLLKFIIDEYVNRQNKTLGLLVDEANPNAKRLYLKLGFEPVGTKILLGKKMEHLQIKS
jgi:ribosomal protein S18 acetylase RimI-like enzyme